MGASRGRDPGAAFGAHDHGCRARAFHLELGSSLEGDLGFDSLARARLMLRIERSFHLKLPEERLAQAKTLRDLLLALGGADARPGARRDPC